MKDQISITAHFYLKKRTENPSKFFYQLHFSTKSNFQMGKTVTINEGKRFTRKKKKYQINV